jgi:acyl-CoA synthetase (AMP-forming)/AMP-acid ligase II
MDVPGKEKYDVSSMKSLVCAAAPCPAELKKKIVDFFGPVFYEFYGSTDAMMNAILKPEHYQKCPDKMKSVGKVLDGNKIKIVDEDGKEVPPNQPGEMVLSSVVVKNLEYHKDPEKTRESFMSIDGEMYFKEGEIGYFDDEGFLYIVDRKKDMIISGGVNIYPAEIEEVLLLHPCVLDAAVIGVPDEKWGESIKAVVVLREGKGATEAEIIEYCNEKLAGYKRPRSVDFVNELPRLPSGKLLKRELKEKYRVCS